MKTTDGDTETQKPRRWLLLLWAVFGIVAAVRVLHATAPFGPGVSGDSLQYMSAALDLAAGETVKGWDGGMYVSWPPLYPALLMILRWFGGNFLESARWLNALALGCTVFLTGAFCLRHIQSVYVRTLGTAMAGSSVALFEMSVMLWSEPVFVLLLTAQLATLAAFLRTRSKVALLLAAGLAGLACMQRYPGVTIIGVSGLTILYPAANTKFHWRVVHAAGFGLIAATPLALWLKRNRDLEGIATSWAGGKTQPIPDNVASALDVLFTWSIPSSPLYRMAAVAIFAIVGALVFAALLRSGIEKRVRMPVALHSFFAFVYVSFLCYSGSRYSIEPINQRYLSPIFISLVIVSVTLLDIAVRYWRERTLFRLDGRFVAAIAIALCAAWLYYPFASTKILSDRYRRDGVFGFTNATYVHSPLVQAAREHLPENAHVYSNHPELLFVNANITSARAYPGDDMFLAAIEEARGHGVPVYLVWFASAHGAPTPGPDAGALATGEALSSTPDGTIHRWSAETQ